MPYSNSYTPSPALLDLISRMLTDTLNKRYCSETRLDREEYARLGALEDRLRAIRQDIANSTGTPAMGGRLAFSQTSHQRRHVLTGFRKAGRALAHYMAGGEDVDIEDVFNRLPTTLLNNDAFMEVFARAATEQGMELQRCASCNDWYDSSCQHDVSDTHEGPICEGCNESHIQLPDGANVDINVELIVTAFTDARNWQPCCPEMCRERDTGRIALYATPNNDVEYMTMELIERLGWENDGHGYAPVEEPSSDDDEENHGDFDRYGVYPYHQHPLRRNGRYFNEPSDASKTNIPIGMELEVYCEGSPSNALDAAGLNWILEDDGSLDSQYGVEIVSPPLGRAQWEDTLPKLCNALEDEQTQTHSPECGNDYGIHLSVNAAYVSKLSVMRMSMFFMAEENRDFVRAICQRREIYSAPYQCGLGQTPKARQRVSTIGHLTPEHRNLVGVGKFMPVALKTPSSQTGGDRLIEFRGFNASHNPKRIRKNMEFVWSLLRWTSTAVCSSGWCHQDYLSWLATVANDYPSLHAYLVTTEKFSIKNLTPITNVWAPLLVKRATKTGKPTGNLAYASPMRVKPTTTDTNPCAELDMATPRVDYGAWHPSITEAMRAALPPDTDMRPIEHYPFLVPLTHDCPPLPVGHPRRYVMYLNGNRTVRQHEDGSLHGVMELTQHLDGNTVCRDIVADSSFYSPASAVAEVVYTTQSDRMYSAGTFVVGATSTLEVIGICGVGYRLVRDHSLSASPVSVYNLPTLWRIESEACPHVSRTFPTPSDFAAVMRSYPFLRDAATLTDTALTGRLVVTVQSAVNGRYGLAGATGIHDVMRVVRSGYNGQVLVMNPQTSMRYLHDLDALFVVESSQVERYEMMPAYNTGERVRGDQHTYEITATCGPEHRLALCTTTVVPTLSIYSRHALSRM